MRRNSIVVIIDEYRDPFAGTEGQVYKLVKGLSGRGWKVRLAVFRETEFIRNGDFPAPVDVLNVGSLKNMSNLLKVFFYGRWLKRENIAVAHIFFNDASVLVPPVFWILGIRSVISRRDMGFWYTKLYRVMLPWTGVFVDAVICNSKAVATITKRVEKFPDRKTVVIYNGYPDLEAQEEYKLEDSEKDNRAGVFIIGLVANVRPIKRIEDLILASPELAVGGIPFEIHIIGGGDSSALKATAESLGIGNQVVFWGSRSDVSERIKEFDVAVLCSESEGFSNSIIEYMRAGKPVVCTNVGGNPEIVEHGVTGYLYPVGDTAALGRHLLELARSPEKRKEMGRRGLERVQVGYTIGRMLDEHQALYERIIGKGWESNA